MGAVMISFKTGPCCHPKFVSSTRQHLFTLILPPPSNNKKCLVDTIVTIIELFTPQVTESADQHSDMDKLAHGLARSMTLDQGGVECDMKTVQRLLNI